MRDIEDRRIALECLRIAQGNISHAENMLTFVTGSDQDDAKRKLDVVRVTLTQACAQAGS